ncbi:hypothetical protein Tco_0631510 [Tanacetum coccineum]
MSSHICTGIGKGWSRPAGDSRALVTFAAGKLKRVVVMRLRTNTKNFQGTNVLVRIENGPATLPFGNGAVSVLADHSGAASNLEVGK